MKTYKDFTKVYIGSSDIAMLTLVGIAEDGDVGAKLLKFGSDGSYDAYLVVRKKNEDVLIGSHYELKMSFTHWIRVYDDDTLRLNFTAKKINVYRAGIRGCIIEMEV